MSRDPEWWLIRAPVVRDKDLLAEVDKWAEQVQRSRSNAIKYLVKVGLIQVRKRGEKHEPS